MWRIRVKMLRGAPLTKADASLKLSLERLELAQPGQFTPQVGPERTPPTTTPEAQSASDSAQIVPRGSLFTPSSDVFEKAKRPDAETVEDAEPIEAAETVEDAELAEQTTNDPELLATTPSAPLPAPAPYLEPSEPTPYLEQAVPAPYLEPGPSTTGSQQPSTVDPAATPPHLSVPAHLLREENQAPPAKRQAGISHFNFSVAVILAALLSALLTYSFANSPPPTAPLSPQLSELAQSIANQKLATGQGELERRERLVVHDEERLLKGLEVLVKSNEELARQHQRSLQRARKLEASLGGFASRAEAISRTGPSPTLRDSATTLEAEAQGYLTALGQVAEQLDSEREAALGRALRLRDHLDHRPLHGRQVRVIYDPVRKDDAARVVELLGTFEIDAQLFEAEVANPTALKGRLFYSADEEEAAAHQIARLVESLEEVEPEKIGVASPYMSLWVVGEPF